MNSFCKYDHLTFYMALILSLFPLKFNAVWQFNFESLRPVRSLIFSLTRQTSLFYAVVRTLRLLEKRAQKVFEYALVTNDKEEEFSRCKVGLFFIYSKKGHTVVFNLFISLRYPIPIHDDHNRL